MTGPEHYKEAELLLAGTNDYDTTDAALVDLAAADVHATLALAAATALGGPQYNEWVEAAGTAQEREGVALMRRRYEQYKRSVRD